MNATIIGISTTNNCMSNTTLTSPETFGKQVTLQEIACRTPSRYGN